VAKDAPHAGADQRDLLGQQIDEPFVNVEAVQAGSLLIERRAELLLIHRIGVSLERRNFAVTRARDWAFVNEGAISLACRPPM